LACACCAVDTIAVLVVAPDALAAPVVAVEVAAALLVTAPAPLEPPLVLPPEAVLAAVVTRIWLLLALPVAVPPEVLIRIWFRIVGVC